MRRVRRTLWCRLPTRQRCHPRHRPKPRFPPAYRRQRPREGPYTGRSLWQWVLALAFSVIGLVLFFVPILPQLSSSPTATPKIPFRCSFHNGKACYYVISMMAENPSTSLFRTKKPSTYRMFRPMIYIVLVSDILRTTTRTSVRILPIRT